MFKSKRLLVFGPITLALFVFLTYFAIVPGFQIDRAPRFVQGPYYAAMGRAGLIDLKPNSPFMREVHSATLPNKAALKTPYTFKYTKVDLGIIEKDSRRCQACHGTMLQAARGKPLFPIHTTMLTARLLSFHCTDCHKRVDLGRRDPSRATVRVDRTQCTRCHEDNKDNEKTGLMNVRGENAIPEQYLISNHGTDPESGEQWIKRHAKVGPEIGVKKCRRCHQLGSELDFCGDCHGRDVPKIKAPQD